MYINKDLQTFDGKSFVKISWLCMVMIFAYFQPKHSPMLANLTQQQWVKFDVFSNTIRAVVESFQRKKICYIQATKVVKLTVNIHWQSPASSANNRFSFQYVHTGAARRDVGIITAERLWLVGSPITWITDFNILFILSKETFRIWSSLSASLALTVFSSKATL